MVRIGVRKAAPNEVSAGLLAVGIHKGEGAPEGVETAAGPALGDFSGKEGETALLYADLGEAIKEAENSELLYRALGEHVYTRLLEVKRAEFEDYRVQVTPYEIEKYLPVL